MRVLVLLLLVVLTFTDTVSVNAQDVRQELEKVEGIVAIVNDDAITASDLFDRFSLVSSSSGLPNTPEIRNRFLPQILNVLIDEKLQLQEAKRLDVQIRDQDIARGIQDIAAQNRMDAEQFMGLIDSKNLSTDSLKEQVRAQVAWRKVIARRIRSQIDITPQDVEAEYNRLLANAGKQEYRIAEIYLPVDENNSEENVRDLSGRIVSELAEGKTNFGALARQFSQNASAGAGGLLGWVFAEQLPDEVAAELKTLQAGSISRPIKTLSGYHIVLLQNKRVFEVPDETQNTVDLKQIFLSFDGKKKKAIRKQAIALKEEIGGCLSISNYYGDYEHEQTGDIGTVQLNNVPELLQSIARSAPIAEIAEPIEVKEGIYLVMVCERNIPKTNFPSQEDINNALGQERLQVLERRHLQDLRATSFIERRG